MAKARTPKRTTPVTNTPHWSVLALAVAGMLLTGYLSIIAWSDSGASLCGPESSCDVIQQSRWSVVLRLHLAFWGFLLYALIGALAREGTSGVQSWRGLWS